MSQTDIRLAIEAHKDLLPASTEHVDFPKLLLALSGVESSYGVNAVPRHESSWCRKDHGRNVNHIVVARDRRWGCESCCSWGPWQILYHTAADIGFTGAPHELADPAICLPYIAKRLHALVKEGAVSVDAFADGWNSGTSRDGIIPTVYIALVQREYAKC